MYSKQPFLSKLILVATGILFTAGCIFHPKYTAEQTPSQMETGMIPHTNIAGTLQLPTPQHTVSLFPDNTAEMERRAGMIGRLYIPEDSICVAVFDTRTFNGANRQLVVDAEDSAALFYLNKQCTIGDHDMQGFENIRKSVAGKTIAYIQKGSYTDAYLCIETGEGHNTGSTITDQSGKSVKERNDASMLLYTCHGNWQDISYTVWTQIPTPTALAG